MKFIQAVVPIFLSILFFLAVIFILSKVIELIKKKQKEKKFEICKKQMRSSTMTNYILENLSSYGTPCCIRVRHDMISWKYTAYYYDYDTHYNSNKILNEIESYEYFIDYKAHKYGILNDDQLCALTSIISQHFGKVYSIKGIYSTYTSFDRLFFGDQMLNDSAYPKIKNW